VTFAYLFLLCLEPLRRTRDMILQ